MTWEIAPLRAAALRTERAVNQRWQTLRAAVIGGAVLLGVIGSAAALSLTGSSLPGGMGFLSAEAASSSDHELTAREARDGVVEQGAPPATPDPPADEDDVATTSDASSGSAPAAAPEPERGTPSADPQPAPAPTVAPTTAPTPAPAPSTPPASSADDEESGGGLLGDLIDILLPGLLP